MKKIVIIVTLFNYIFSFSQEVIEETILESTEVEETVIESTETGNVNQYYQNNTTDIVTGEIDNTLLIFKGKNSSLYGLKDKAGKILVKPIFYSINSYGSTKDRIKASLSYGKEGIIDGRGNIIIPFEYSGFYNNNRNVYTAKKDGKSYMFDYYGNKLLKKAYDEISIDDIYCKIKENGFYGMLNSNGEELLPTKYDEIYYFPQEEWFLVTKNGVSNIIYSNGKNVFGNKFSSVSKLDYYFKYILAEKGGKFGIIDKNGNEITPIIFDDIEKDYNGNFFIVKQNEKWGLYNIIFNQFLIEPTYDNIRMLSNNYYLVKTQNNKTLIDILLNKKIDFTSYDEVNNYINKNIAVVKQNELRGAVNVESGKLVIPTKYNYLDVNSYYIKGTLPNSRLSDLYNYDGDLIYKNVSFIKSLSNYAYSKITSEGKMGLMYKGDELIPAEFDQIEDFKNISSYVLVKKDNKSGVVSLNDGSFLIPLNSGTISIDEDKNIINHKNKKYRITLNKLVEIK
ncbi:WG repeat-containing protein [Aureibaculum sp. 2210JD6-5]|uniref:WG repeat-containing protein n=1 Tax=Aureibaculum sp. 2210JD6-5 TaxID=3103957 RepID=UPI002AADF99D|nr:WG repeat-containing protein [Aureibaculum sp. 2210JD6-5]MDY7396019.1 WG repeat-containing protein [Aureibaculum sp. 2210JD6-5]